MKKVFYLILICAAAGFAACTGRQADGGTAGERHPALPWLCEALECDKAEQFRRAELCYRKAYDLLKDNPSQDWTSYGDAGYRYASLLYQRGDTEGALAIVNEMLNKAEGQKDFPATPKTGLLSLMAQCQLHLSMPEAAKQTFAKAYENELSVLGGEERGNLNLAFICSNIFCSFFETGEYEEAEMWLGRYEREILACEKLGVGDSMLIEELKGSLALYKAQYLQATDRPQEAAAVYAAIPHSRISIASNILDATGYLTAAGRYDEAAYWYKQFNSTFLATVGTNATFDNIAAYLCPCYLVYRKAGHDADALTIADSISAAIDSALVRQKKNDAAELAVIYQTHERDLQIKDLQFTISFHRLLFIAGGIIILLIAYLFVRARIYNKVLAEKNRGLYQQIQQLEQAEAEQREQMEAQPVETLSQNQQLYRHLCELMKNPGIYTDAKANHETLARLLGTNTTYLYAALHECADQTPADFLNLYRIRYAAHLLTTTDDSVGLIIEQSGITNRSTFNRLFREYYSMSPSEFRNASRADVQNK